MSNPTLDDNVEDKNAWTLEESNWEFKTSEFNKYHTKDGKIGMYVLKLAESGRPHEKKVKLTNTASDLDWEKRSWTRLEWAGGSGVLFATRGINFEDVLQVQPGQHTANFQRFIRGEGAGCIGFGGWGSEIEDAKDLSFSIIYRDDAGRERSTGFICESHEQYTAFMGMCRGIIRLIKLDRKNTSEETQFLKKLWRDANVLNEAALSLPKMKSILQKVNVNQSSREIENKFRKVDYDASNKLDFVEFIRFFEMLRVRPEFEHLWVMLISKDENDSIYSVDAQGDLVPYKLSPHRKTEGYISLDQFHDFIRDHQKEDVSREDLLERIEIAVNATYVREAIQASDEEDVDVIFNKKDVTYRVFKAYMKSHFNSLRDWAATKVPHDMSQPLSNYFIASSHNTYLEGHQLTSFSSTKRYINDLLESCRCVELDCWNGPASKDDPPIITHGHTLTGTISFKNAIEAINEYAFVTSEYPVILSIEQHCDDRRQLIMANMLKEVFGEKLQWAMEDVGEHTLLPSPEALKGKILIKGKRSESEQKIDEKEEDDDDVPASKRRSKEGGQDANLPTPPPSDSSSKDAGFRAMSEITFLGTGKVKKFDSESLALPCDKMCSYTEGKRDKYISAEDSKKGWVEHNKAHLSRIYPGGFRVNSSNYNPVTAWATGNQLVALNYQTGDEGMFYNRGKFVSNNHTGYLLKPACLRDDSPPTPGFKLQIHVCGAAHLPKPGGSKKGEVIDPYVEVEIFSSESRSISDATVAIDNNGFDPQWNSVLSFRVPEPDHAMVLFKIMDEDELGTADFIAYACMPALEIRQGLRTVKLCDKDGYTQGAFKFAKLYVNVKISPL